METLSGTAIKQTVEAFQKDMAKASTIAKELREFIGQLELDAKGLNGAGAFLRAQGQTLDKMIADLDEESERVAIKLLGSTRPEIVQTVSREHADKVKAARGA